MQNVNENNVLSVSALNAITRELLETAMGVVWLSGEISNLSMPSSGHWYFGLKDHNAQVRCAMFRAANRMVNVRPANGMQVLVQAQISLYEARGEFQLIVQSLQLAGDGLLRLQFEQLKQKLAQEGLFASDKKRSLPAYPRQIGVITSATGAALHDILQVLRRRDPSLAVVIYPTLVQGELAAQSIASAIARANARGECDVLIVGRGGGSLEDLACFNDERVARAIAQSQLPVVSAVGHETDITIADFVADLRASTPSAAAELVSQDRAMSQLQLTQLQARLNKAWQQRQVAAQQRLALLNQRLLSAHPKNKLQQQTQRLDELERRLEQGLRALQQKKQTQLQMRFWQLQQQTPAHKIQMQCLQLNELQQQLKFAVQQPLQHGQQKLAQFAMSLEQLSPLATLARGYGIVFDSKNRVVSDAGQVQTGQALMVKLAKGELQVLVEKTQKG
ncbi:MAG: exodeoxyribonuclease VII large subunit [Enterovibrio sp.]